MNYEAAKKKALKLRPDIDICREHTDAFIFSVKDDISFGGDGPVVILKENGRAINMADYLDDFSGEFVKEYPI